MLFTYIIIAITVLISLKAFNDQDFFSKLSFSPYQIKQNNQWYRVFTHAFIHADFFHLILNMFVLSQFGEVVELKLKFLFPDTSIFIFLTLYIGGILFSTLLAFHRHQDNVLYQSVGASGAVSSIVFACILMIPNMELSLLILPIPMPAFIFGLLYITAEIVMDKRASKSNIAHDAHFMGALFGMVFIVVLSPDILKNFIEYIKYYF